jgi:two-component system, probable response regulator PhcQ
VTLPCLTRGSEDAVERAEAGESSLTHAVLLIDDDEDILHGLTRALHHQPYRIYTVTSGEEAKFVLKSHQIGVVVADEQMPGMCGGDLLAWIADQCPEVMRIVLTGHPTVKTAIRAINEGRVYQFFTKPCNSVQLGMAIRKALEHKELAKEHRRLINDHRRQAEEIQRFRAELTTVNNMIAWGIRPFFQSKLHRYQSPGDESEHISPASGTMERAIDSLSKVQSIVDTLIGRSKHEKR